MSYTRPDYDAADATWSGASAYTRPGYSAADAAWATVEARGWALEDAGPLGDTLAIGAATAGAWALADSMLGPELASGGHICAGRALMPGVTVGETFLGQTDFSNAVSESSQTYVMDLETPSGVVRVPISSWQATLQVDRDSYLQAVIPACEEFVDDIETATAFTVYRNAWALDGSILAQQPIASSPISHVQLAQGSRNYTATVSGYSPGAAYDATPNPAFDRTLRGVQTVFTDPSGLRVRCSIDWFLRPAQRAYLGTTPLIVGYMNLYVTDTQAYMDVGESRDF